MIKVQWLPMLALLALVALAMLLYTILVITVIVYKLREKRKELELQRDIAYIKAKHDAKQVSV